MGKQRKDNNCLSYLRRVRPHIRWHLIFICFFVYTFPKAGSRLHHETDGVKTKDSSSNLVSSLFYNNLLLRLLLLLLLLGVINIQRTISFASHLWRTSKVSRIRKKKEKRKRKRFGPLLQKCFSGLNSNTKVVPPLFRHFQPTRTTLSVSSFSFLFDLTVCCQQSDERTTEKGFP